ncbi:hypothetical protein CEXT_314011 [Caerostris extrusa]|uniref:Uncharacterized protein n=1 Tax=Caerostris extrusa TaxID=172846 RepID=A0AAV4PB32_CAEEX|nr:hypothetical protein CEXT_314011 [Caerostris extrusa]
MIRRSVKEGSRIHVKIVRERQTLERSRSIKRQSKEGDGAVRYFLAKGNFHANERELFSGWPHLFMMHPSLFRHLNFHSVPLKLNDFKTIRACLNFLRYAYAMLLPALFLEGVGVDLRNPPSLPRSLSTPFFPFYLGFIFSLSSPRFKGGEISSLVVLRRGAAPSEKDASFPVVLWEF